MEPHRESLERLLQHGGNQPVEIRPVEVLAFAGIFPLPRRLRRLPVAVLPHYSIFARLRARGLAFSRSMAFS
jgi:hypothetical protein